ncbi:MAG: glycosyltransferase family 2 protein [Planctomycetes bacterium]|nr:glycosyltransferase family 2 protein [Planctomycetota bacterium]
MTTPTLSVVMPNYNHGRYLKETLQALFDQSWPASEVIVIDDASTDDSVAVIESFLPRNPALRLLRNDRNRGAAFSVNRGLQIAAGDFIYPASSDDRVLPGLFEESMRLLTRHPQAGLCCSDPAWFNEMTGRMSTSVYEWAAVPTYLPPADVAARVTNAHIAGHTSVLRRAALLEAGDYRPELRWHSDWFAVHVIAFRHGVCYIPKALAWLRMSPGSYSSRRRRWRLQRRVLVDMLDLLKSDEYRDVLPLFLSGKLLTAYGREILAAVATTPRHWDSVGFSIAREVLAKEVRRAHLRLPAVRTTLRRFFHTGS